MGSSMEKITFLDISQPIEAFLFVRVRLYNLLLVGVQTLILVFRIILELVCLHCSFQFMDSIGHWANFSFCLQSPGLDVGCLTLLSRRSYKANPAVQCRPFRLSHVRVFSREYR